jgi:hypothetical protein
LFAIDTEQELQEKSETIDHKLKILRKKIKESNDKMFNKINKRLKKQSEMMAKIAGLPSGSSLSQAGSIKGGSVYNLSLGPSKH